MVSGKHTRTLGIIATVGLVAGMFALMAPSAGAATCGVTNETTAATYTDLQAAINDALPGDTLQITDKCVGNFTVDKDDGDTHAGVDLTLQGPATLDGAGLGTVLRITHGSIAIKSLTITNGLATVASHLFNDGQTKKLCCSGGGIAVEGAAAQAELTNSLVTKNLAAAPWGRGGGIDVNEGALTLDNSTVSKNTATNAAGIDSNFATVTLTNSTVSGNVASGQSKFCQAISSCAGGIWNYGGTLTLDNSTISGNTAYWRGGGIVNQLSGGVLKMTGSTTVTANQALITVKKLRPAGGGIYQRGGVLQSDWRTYVFGNFSYPKGVRTEDNCFDLVTNAPCL